MASSFLLPEVGVIEPESVMSQRRVWGERGTWHRMGRDIMELLKRLGLSPSQNLSYGGSSSVKWA